MRLYCCCRVLLLPISHSISLKHIEALDVHTFEFMLQLKYCGKSKYKKCSAPPFFIGFKPFCHLRTQSHPCCCLFFGSIDEIQLRGFAKCTSINTTGGLLSTMSYTWAHRDSEEDKSWVSGKFLILSWCWLPLSPTISLDTIPWPSKSNWKGSQYLVFVIYPTLHLNGIWKFWKTSDFKVKTKICPLSTSPLKNLFHLVYILVLHLQQ